MPVKRKTSDSKRKTKLRKRDRESELMEENPQEEEDEELIYEDAEEDVEYDSEEEERFKEERRERRLRKQQERNEQAPMDEEASSSGPQPLFSRPKKGEKLEVDRRAYDMRHVLNMEWPCLSFDVLNDTDGLGRVKYPLSCMIVSGTQAEDPSQGQILVKKISHLCRTRHDRGDDDSSSEEDEEEEEEEDDEADDADPIIFTKEYNLGGNLLRIRAMPQHTGIVACWTEDGPVQALDLRDQCSQLNDPKSWIAQQAQKRLKKKKDVSFFKSSSQDHAADGFALAWNPKAEGLLASGDSNGKINIWQRSSESGAGFTATPLQGHEGSVEDLQWSPTQENVLSSCSVDGTIRMWDVRDLKSPEKLKWTADAVDINVISWNMNAGAGQFMASGSDAGVFKVWDLRMVKRADVTPISEFNFHQESISSIEWCPLNSSLLAVASSDMVTFWDFSVERDEEVRETAPDDDTAVPPQLMFLHQGVEECKEIHWHTQIPGLMIATDLNGFQFFKPVNWKSMLQ
uniref:Histone-binding protein RBBP4-like N-terminal domain-containing protein n=1 Tax=Eutreptiella gymnastica TaxID=73025 RepID=A0A7S4C8Q3_9EUGL